VCGGDDGGDGDGGGVGGGINVKKVSSYFGEAGRCSCVCVSFSSRSLVQQIGLLLLLVYQYN